MMPGQQQPDLITKGFRYQEARRFFSGRKAAQTCLLIVAPVWKTEGEYKNHR